MPHPPQSMAEARRRLLETTTSVESIPSQVGCSDVTSCVRGFRRAHGLTPRAWRERHRQEGGRLNPVNFHCKVGPGADRAPRA